MEQQRNDKWTQLALRGNLQYLTLNDWSRGEQWILFPENLNVSRDEVEGNIEIRGKQKWFDI